MLSDYLSYIQESRFISDKTISIDLDKFINGQSKKLLIAGLSGGGKTTLCYHLAKSHNAQCFETDNCVHMMKHPNKMFGKENPPLNILKEVFHEGYTVCVRKEIKNNKRQIIEGGLVWQTYVFFPEFRKELNQHPVIIFGSSALKASWGVWQRVQKKKGTIGAIKKIPLMYERNFKLLSGLMDQFRNIRIEAGGNIQEFKIPKL